MEKKCDICKRPFSGNIAMKSINVWGNHICCDCYSRYKKEMQSQNLTEIEMDKRITDKARNHKPKGSFSTYNAHSPNPFIIGYGDATMSFETMDDVIELRDKLNKLIDNRYI